MDQQPATNTRPPWQFSLGSLMAAVAFVASACAAGKYLMGVTDDRPASPLDYLSRFLMLFAIPVLLCGAIGVLRGKLKFWLAYGVMVATVLWGLLFVFG